MGESAHRLFGTLAIDHGLIGPAQLRSLIEEQATSDEPVRLGELARRRGLLSTAQVRRLLQIQQRQTAPAVLGELVLRNAMATPDELESALAVQEEDPGGAPRLGEILVERGSLTPQELHALLAAQRRLRGEHDDRGLELETRTLLAVDAPSLDDGSAVEPQGWLIQESGDDAGTLFKLGTRAILGRQPGHDVAVPDMAASRDHAQIEFDPAQRRHVVSDLGSRNGTFVNGAQLVRPRALEPGDRIQVGATVLRYAAGATVRPTDNGGMVRAAKQAVSKAIPMLRQAGDTAWRLLPSRKKRAELLEQQRDLRLAQLGLAAGAAPVEAKKRGRAIVDRGPAPEGQMGLIIEIRNLDAEIAALPPETKILYDPPPGKR